MTLALDGGTGHTRGAPMHFKDVRGHVWVHQALRLPIGLLMLAQGDAVLDRDMGAGPFRSCISLRSGCCVPTAVSWKVLCSHFRMPWSRMTLFSSVSLRLST